MPGRAVSKSERSSPWPAHAKDTEGKSGSANPSRSSRRAVLPASWTWATHLRQRRLNAPSAPSFGTCAGRARSRCSSSPCRSRRSSRRRRGRCRSTSCPPNGVGRCRTFSELTQTMPASSACANAMRAADIAGPDIAREAVVDVVGDARAHPVSSSNGIAVSTGPKISSCAIRIWIARAANSVGLTKLPSPAVARAAAGDRWRPRRAPTSI